MQPKPRKTYKRFTSELKRLFVEHYEDGITISEAAVMVGVSRRTIYLAEQRDPEFAAALNAARDAHLENLRDVLLTQIKQADNWQAKAFLLERLFPDDFARPAPRHFANAQTPNFTLTTQTIEG